jgi:hypothetical protein
MKKIIRLSISILFITIFVSCAMTPLQAYKSYSEMSFQEKFTYFIHIYNSQYDNYEQQADVLSRQTHISIDEIKIMRAKWDCLDKMKIILDQWELLLSFGSGNPSPESEQQLLDLVDKLVKIGGV